MQIGVGRVTRPPHPTITPGRMGQPTTPDSANGPGRLRQSPSLVFRWATFPLGDLSARYLRLGRLDRRLQREVAGGHPGADAVRLELWLLGRADLLGDRAAGAEPAAGRRVPRARQAADDAPRHLG